jgi:isoleucyl-tRNA synthetase
MDELSGRGLLLRRDVIRHTYPFCWRCDTPLLYYAKPTWYIRTTAVKDSLIAGNERINWYPGHIKHGRFGDWLNNNVDWALSRERWERAGLACDTCAPTGIGSPRSARAPHGGAWTPGGPHPPSWTSCAALRVRLRRRWK